MHKPTGIRIKCTQERSQLKNKDLAMKMLQTKLYDIELEKKNEAERVLRGDQVGTGSRSEKIRTYVSVWVGGGGANANANAYASAYASANTLASKRRRGEREHASRTINTPFSSRARAMALVRPPKMPYYPSYGPIRPAGGP